MLGHGGALRGDIVVSPVLPGRCDEVESGSKVRESQLRSNVFSIPAGFCFPWVCGQ